METIVRRSVSYQKSKETDLSRDSQADPTRYLYRTVSMRSRSPVLASQEGCSRLRETCPSTPFRRPCCCAAAQCHLHQTTTGAHKAGEGLAAIGQQDRTSPQLRKQRTQLLPADLDNQFEGPLQSLNLLIDAGQEGFNLRDATAADNLVSVGCQVMSCGDAVFDIIINKAVVLQGNAIKVILPLPVEKTNKAIQLLPYGVVSRVYQAFVNLAYYDAPSSDAPGEIKPDNHVGSMQQLLRPPEIVTFRNPGRLGSDTAHIGKPYIERAISLHLIFEIAFASEVDLIKVVDRYAKACRHLTGQSRLSAT